jgi:hypothetical protein
MRRNGSRYRYATLRRFARKELGWQQHPPTVLLTPRYRCKPMV